jgi:hypothetical protein
MKNRSKGICVMKALKLWNWIISFLFIVTFAACSTESGGGTLSLSLSDATTDEYNAVYVTIEEVQVREGEDRRWKVVTFPDKTYNLLELVNGVREQMGITELQTGHYTQMRLMIGDDPDNGINVLSESHEYANYIIDHNDDYQALKIPSGLQTGIKIVHGFDINEGQTTELILDFDASRSIVKAGSSGKWLLKPTIKVLDTEEYSVISGTVKNSDQEPLRGVLVSAQISASGAADEKEKVVVQASTVTDENGSYTIFLESDTYNIVGYKNNYTPGCARIETVSGTTYTENFILSAASTGTMKGEVRIDGGDYENYVTVSIRQSAGCGDNIDQIEVKSINVANGGDYDISLPVATYTVVASSYGEDTQVDDDVEIMADSATITDIVF